MKRRLACLPFAAALLLSAACDDLTTDIADQPTVSLSIRATDGGPSAAAVPPGFSAAVVDPSGRVLNIEQVQAVLREVELERQTDLPGCTSGDDDACEEFEAGPVLIDMPVNGGIITPFEVAIPPGTYDELELEIKRPEDDSTSDAFFAAHPSWPQDAGLRVRGTFDANDGNGPQPFDIFLDVDAEIEMALVPPLVIEEGATDEFNITLVIDVGSWFLSGGSLVDPRGVSIDGDVADLVEDNMEASLEAFEDDDRDGDRSGSNSGPN